MPTKPLPSMAARNTRPGYRIKADGLCWRAGWAAGHQGQQWTADPGNNAGGVDGQAQGPDAVARIDEANQQVAAAPGQAADADASGRDQPDPAAQYQAADADAPGRDDDGDDDDDDDDDGDESYSMIIIIIIIILYNKP